LATGGTLCYLEGHTAAVFSAVFDPKDKYLVSGSHDHTVRIWDIEEEIKAAKAWRDDSGLAEAEEEEARRRVEEEEARRRAEEEEARRRVEEEEARRRAEEDARRRAEEDAARLVAEAAARLAMQAEAGDRAVWSEILAFPGRISSGSWFSLLIAEDGEVYSMGHNMDA